MTVLHFLKNCFEVKLRKKPSKYQKRRKSKMYTAPKVPSWTYRVLLSRSGPEDYYLGDDVERIVSKYRRGAKYRIIRKKGFYIVTPVKQRVERRTRKRKER